MAGFWDSIKNAGTAAVSKENALGAGVDWSKRYVNKGVDYVTAVPKALMGKGGDVGGVAGWAGRGVANAANRTNKIVSGTLNNKVTGGLLMIAATVAIYKGITNYFKRKDKKNEVEAIEGQAAQLEAQNQQMVEEYRTTKAQSYQFNNTRAQGGHVNRYHEQQGAQRGVPQHMH